MLSSLFSFFITAFTSCINVLKSFTLEGNITFYHFLIFCIFVRIVIFLLEYLKQITIVDNESSSNSKNEMRKKK